MIGDYLKDSISAHPNFTFEGWDELENEMEQEYPLELSLNKFKEFLVRIYDVDNQQPIYFCEIEEVIFELCDLSAYQEIKRILEDQFKDSLRTCFAKATEYLFL